VLPAAARERIDRADATVIDRWLTRVLDATSLAAVLED